MAAHFESYNSYIANYPGATLKEYSEALAQAREELAARLELTSFELHALSPNEIDIRLSAKEGGIAEAALYGAGIESAEVIESLSDAS